jgi:hypothetical protein
MRKIPGLLFVIIILTACANAPEPSAPTQLAPTVSSTHTPLPSTSEADPATPALTEPVEVPTLPAPAEDFFTQMGITHLQFGDTVTNRRSLLHSRYS